MNSRITPQEVKAAFQKCGLTPTRRFFVQLNEDLEPIGCCAISAMYLAEKGTETLRQAIRDKKPLVTLNSPTKHIIRQWAEDRYGWVYTETFIAGFDGEARHYLPDTTGYKDGLAVAKSVL
jgi:hypothetical protein